MKIKIQNGKASLIFLDGVYYDCNKEIEVNFSEAQRLVRSVGAQIVESNMETYDPALFKDERRFAFMSEIDEVSGWGNVSTNLIKYSARKYDISQIGKLMNVTENSVLKANRRDIDPHEALIIHEQPKNSWFESPFQKKIAIVPFETTKIPSSWINRINSCDALLVPCMQNMEAFKASGVKIPIELIHWGVDPKKFYELERPAVTTNRPFTFGTMGALSLRKGTDVLVKAFLRAFPNGENVRLICKTSFYHFMFATKDKRVKVDVTPVPHEELLNTFFKEVDCFVFPTRGEGFGLTPLEAMATGIPAIVTGWSGPVEYMTPEVGWTINHTMTPAKDFSETVYKEDCGDWAEPSEDHLVELLRYAYEHQDEVRQKGKNAAEHVRKDWLWDTKIEMFHDALEKHL